jgi:hypothetical protein
MIIAFYLLCLLVLLLVVKLNKKFEDKILFTLILIGILLWNILPTSLTFAFWNSDFTFRIVSFEEFVKSADIELAYLAVNLILMLYFATRTKSLKGIRLLSVMRDDAMAFCEKLVTFSCVVLLIYNIIMLSNFSIGYFSSLSEQSTTITLFLPFVITCRAILFVYIIYYRNIKIKTLISFLTIMLDLVITLASGSRIVLISMVLLPVLIYLDLRKSLSTIRKIGLFVAFIGAIILVVKVVPAIENIRHGNSALKFKDVNREMNLTSNDTKSRFMHSFLVKLGSIQNATILVKNEGYNTKGLTELLNPFKILIPRFIWPEKYKNFNKNSGKVAAKYMGMDEKLGVVGTSPALSLLWSNGLLGIIVSILFSAMFFSFIFNLMQYDTILSKAFILVFLNFPILDRIPTTYGAIINIFILQAIVYLVFFMAAKVTFKRYSHVNE